jgi:beta-N-acetylhexosaminidase
LYSNIEIPDGTYPVCFGLEGKTLLDSEREFFQRYLPLGFILFARNIDAADQVRQLVTELRELVGWHCPILIDQEGGRVARLRPPHWPKFPSMEPFATQAESDLEAAKLACYENATLLGKELADLGVNVNCAPVCDLRIPGAHDIVGDRSFGSDPDIVAIMARVMAEGLVAKQVHPIIKHIPGHGRAMVDSHESLPVVTEGYDVLQETDFKVFKQLHDMPFAMTAHIVYSAIDEHDPATFSKKMIQDVIRNDIGFSGVIFSDDLSMKALSGDMSSRASKSIEAGCDVVLHCNGDGNEMQAVVEGLSPMGEQQKQHFINCYS